jgi:hypothetical protein
MKIKQETLDKSKGILRVMESVKQNKVMYKKSKDNAKKANESLEVVEAEIERVTEEF